MKDIHWIFFLITSVFFVGCESSDSESDVVVDASYNWEQHVPFTTDYQIFSMPFTEDFNPIPQEKGEVALSEASGLAFSVKNKDMIWSHNDSGNANILFLINAKTGEIMARYTIMGTSNLDWEDMEITIDSVTGEPYVYIADIGDNSESRSVYAIYRFKEPQYDSEHYGRNIQWSPEDLSRINLTYPDGSHDAESLLVDPVTKDIYLVTKRDYLSTLYVLPFPYKTEGINTMYKAGVFSFREASAGTVSLDGTKIMIKNRQDIFYWNHNPNQHLWQTLAQTPVKAPYAGEPQGEAVAFDIDNNYFTLSEALNNNTKPILYKYIYLNNK